MLKTKQYCVAGIITPCVFAVLFFAFAPEPRTNSVIESWRKITKHPGQLCLEYTRGKLRDPDSIRLIDWKKDGTSENIYDVLITYKATNSHGAYVVDTQKCDMVQGKVDVSGTKVSDTIKKLEIETAILEEKIKESKRRR